MTLYGCALSDVIAPARNNDNDKRALLELVFPWLPEWVDYNLLLVFLAIIIIILVAIAILCVALPRRKNGPESVRLRGS
jgi:hypothetical protein